MIASELIARLKILDAVSWRARAVWHDTLLTQGTARAMDHQERATVRLDYIGEPRYVSTRALLKAARALPSKGRVYIEATPAGVSVCGTARSIALCSSPAPECEPLPPAEPTPGGLMCPSATLLDLLDRTYRHMSTEKPRYYLCGIHLRSEGDTLRAAATDGYSLSVAYADTDGLGAHKINLIVPSWAIAPLRLLLQGGGEAEFRTADWEGGWVSTSRGSLSFRAINGTFPDINRVMPKSSGGYSFDPKSLHLNGYEWLKLYPEADVLRVETPSGEHPPIPIETHGNPEPVKISTEILKPAMLSFGRVGRVRVDIEGSESPILLTTPDHPRVKQVVMPMVW